MRAVCLTEVLEQVCYRRVGSAVQNRVMNLCGMNTEYHVACL